MGPRGPLSNIYIYVLTTGWSKKDVLEALAFIRRNGGTTVSDPLAKDVTHIVVRPPPCTAREDNQTVYPVGELSIPASVRAWDFDHIVSAFTLPENRARLDLEGGLHTVRVVHENWLRASVDAGHALDSKDDYGGWLIKGKLERDPRKRRQARPDLSPTRDHTTGEFAARQREGPLRAPPHLDRRESRDGAGLERRDSRESDGRDERRPNGAPIDLRNVRPEWSDYFREGKDRRADRRAEPIWRFSDGRGDGGSASGSGEPRPHSPRDGWRAQGPLSPSLRGAKRPRSPDAPAASVNGDRDAQARGMTLRQRLNFQMAHPGGADVALAAPQPKQAETAAGTASLVDRIARAQEQADAHARAALADSPSLASRLGGRPPSSESGSPTPAQRRDSPPAPPASAPPASQPVAAPLPTPTPASTASAPESERPRKKVEMGIVKTEPMEVDELLGGRAFAGEPPSVPPPQPERAPSPPPLRRPTPTLPPRRPTPPVKRSPASPRAPDLPPSGAQMEPVPRTRTPLFDGGRSDRPSPAGSRPHTPNIPPPSSAVRSSTSGLSSSHPTPNAPAGSPRTADMPTRSDHIPEADAMRELYDHFAGGGTIPFDARGQVPRSASPPNAQAGPSSRPMSASTRPRPASATSNTPNTPHGGGAAPFGDPHTPVSPHTAFGSDAHGADGTRNARPGSRSDSAVPAPQTFPSKPRGVFSAPGRPPLKFYVEGNSYKQGIEEVITKQGGGEITSIAQADFIVLPLNRGEEPTDARLRELAAKVGIFPCARVVSREWVIDSVILQGRLMDPEGYIVRCPGGAGASGGAAASRAPSSVASSVAGAKKKARPWAGGAAGASHAGPSRLPAARPAPSQAQAQSTSRTTSPDDITPLESDDDDDADDDSHSEKTILSWDEEIVKRLIEELRAWDETGGKTNFLRNLASEGIVPNATGVYHRYRVYINEQVPALLRHSRKRK